MEDLQVAAFIDFSLLNDHSLQYIPQARTRGSRIPPGMSGEYRRMNPAMAGEFAPRELMHLGVRNHDRLSARMRRRAVSSRAPLSEARNRPRRTPAISKVPPRTIRMLRHGIRVSSETPGSFRKRASHAVPETDVDRVFHTRCVSVAPTGTSLSSPESPTSYGNAPHGRRIEEKPNCSCKVVNFMLWGKLALPEKRVGPGGRPALLVFLLDPLALNGRIQVHSRKICPLPSLVGCT